MGKPETDLPIIIFPYLFHCTQILINPFLDIFFTYLNQTSSFGEVPSLAAGFLRQKVYKTVMSHTPLL